METEKEVFYVLKVDELYLYDVWEEWSDEDNYDFTDKMSSAMKFHSVDASAPKYLWDNKKGKRINTLQDACEFFGGEIVKIEKVTTWKEVCRV